MRRVPVLTAALAVAAWAVPTASLRAQRAGELVTQGIAAYRALEYDAAASLIRRGLSVPTARDMSDSLRLEAQAYLGATEFFRGQVDSAAVAFARALRAEPRFRPDALVFPPTITDFFETVRRRTAFVRVDAPSDTSIRPGQDRFVFRVYGSAPHDVTVVLTARDDQGIRRVLYEGAINDSLEVAWDGYDADQRTPADGDFMIQVTSQSGATRRTVRVPIAADLQRRDTLDLPAPLPASALLPEREHNKQRLGTLVAGVMTGIAAAALPSVVASDGGASRARYVVGGIIGLTGVIGFARQTEYRSIPENMAANARRREDWRREYEAIREENVRRRRDAHLRITVERPAQEDQ